MDTITSGFPRGNVLVLEHDYLARAAQALGPGWRVAEAESPHDNASLAGPEPRRLVFHTHWERGRIVIVGALPHVTGYTAVGACRISVSAACSSDRLAHEITRRLLPVYEAELARRLAFLQQQAEQQRARHALCHELVQLLDDENTRVRPSDDRMAIGFAVSPGCDGMVRLRPDAGSVAELRLHDLTLEQTRQILAIVKVR